MKVIDLLKYSASFYGKADTRRIRFLAEVMDLDVKRKIDDLSYGNKKKVGIVQGLLHRPRLIFLDEPTSGLDPLMQQRFFELIREENKNGATVLFSCHPAEVQKLCSRVGIIKEAGWFGRGTETTGTPRNKIRLEFLAKYRSRTTELSGVSGVKRNHSELSFLYKGEINAPIHKSANLS